MDCTHRCEKQSEEGRRWMQSIRSRLDNEENILGYYVINFLRHLS